MREAMTLVLQELVEAEATAVIGASRYERADDRVTHRNGSRTRMPSTKAGDVELHTPESREGSFLPVLLEPRRRIDRALWAVVMEAHAHGVSTRRADDLVRAPGIGTGIGRSEVSLICGKLDAVVGAFRGRPLDHAPFPYVFLDATHVEAHEGASVVSKATAIATGVTAAGDREVLGPGAGDSEGGAPWTAFLRGLRARRLAGVRLVISGAHEGLKGAIATVLVGAAWQRRRAHFLRSVLSRIQGGRADMVLALVRTIWAQPGAASVRERLDAVADKLPGVPGRRRDAARGPRGRDGVRGLPARPLAEAPLDQPARAGQP